MTNPKYYNDNYSNEAAAYANSGDYVLQIEEVIKRVANDIYKEALKEAFYQHIRTREFVIQHSYMEKIEKHCKIA